MHSFTQRLYAEVKHLPIVSPHGHTDPRWFADNQNFANPTDLFLIPGHYLFRMLYSQGIPLEWLGVPTVNGPPVETDRRTIWRTFANHFHLFRGTPSRMWFDHALYEVLDIQRPFTPENADAIYVEASEILATEAFRPRALFERFHIEVMATTESPLDELSHHRKIRESGWNGNIVTTYRPDAVVDPECESFSENIDRLGELTNEVTRSWSGYLGALRQRRAFFKTMGTTSTDHGHPSAVTANLETSECEKLFPGGIK